MLLEDFSALIWGFPLHEAGCWPSLVSLSMVEATVGLDSSVDSYVVLLVFALVPVFGLGAFDVFIASGFVGLLIGNSLFNFFS